MQTSRFTLAVAVLLFTLLFAAAAAGSGGYCPVGIPWPGFDLDWLESGTITGDGETYAVLFDPTEGCDCPIGFRLTTTEFYLACDPDMPLPATVSVSMSLRTAEPDPDGVLAWVPGSTICETPVRAFTHYIPKDYLGYGLAIDCDCRLMAIPYFLTFTIHSVMDPPGGFYTNGDGSPDPGRFLTWSDGQWIDLAAAGTLTLGDLAVSGFARCCETPVATANQSWSSLKALFR